MKEFPGNDFGERIQNIIDNEGFDYTFVCYDDFKYIKDKKFHTLRLKYLNARQALLEYLEIEE